jgi:hypothetical protein
MEERFRDELKRYVRRPGAPKITPRQIPPLISLSGNLPPTARNKMFNAAIKDKNFGGSWSMPTLTANGATGKSQNLEALDAMLGAAKFKGDLTLGGRTGNSDEVVVTAVCKVFECSNETLLHFLGDYRWLEDEFRYPGRPVDIGLQLEFLRRARHGITSWLIIAPQKGVSFGPEL